MLATARANVNLWCAEQTWLLDAVLNRVDGASCAL